MTTTQANRLTEYRTYWTCEGPVRRGCGIRHRSERAAQQHCERDHRDVKVGHGESAYSDRSPRQVEVAR